MLELAAVAWEILLVGNVPAPTRAWWSTQINRPSTAARTLSRATIPLDPPPLCSVP